MSLTSFLDLSFPTTIWFRSAQSDCQRYRGDPFRIRDPIFAVVRREGIVAPPPIEMIPGEAPHLAYLFSGTPGPLTDVH